MHTLDGHQLCWPQRTTEMNTCEHCPQAAGGLGRKPDVEMLGPAAKVLTTSELHKHQPTPRLCGRRGGREGVGAQLAVCHTHIPLLETSSSPCSGECLLTPPQSCSSSGSCHPEPPAPHTLVQEPKEPVPNFLQAGTERRGISTGVMKFTT